MQACLDFPFSPCADDALIPLQLGPFIYLSRHYPHGFNYCMFRNIIAFFCLTKMNERREMARTVGIEQIAVIDQNEEGERNCIAKTHNKNTNIMCNLSFVE
uniref:Uncharacterized protein n=1 Tax=Heterorhabditis bacteriophora TaxID=37862 RepID=A0A1I7WFM0_HETBA